MSIREKVAELGNRMHRLEVAGDESGARKVAEEIVSVQSGCTHRRTFTRDATQDGRGVKKGDLITWCKECLKLLR